MSKPQDAAIYSLVEKVRQRFEPHGGRATNPKWTERNYIMFSQATKRQLSLLAARVSEHGLRVDPMQIAALIVELVVEEMTQ